MTKAVVDTMLESMKKNLKENMEVIQGLEKTPRDPLLNDMPKNYDLKDFQGQYTGLNRVVMEVENIMRNQTDPDLLDMKPFYDLYKRLQHEEFKSISQDPQTTGYKMGITSGRNYLDALFIHEIKKKEKLQQQRFAAYHR